MDITSAYRLVPTKKPPNNKVMMNFTTRSAGPIACRILTTELNATNGDAVYKLKITMSPKI
jgi:hypothetical protein